MSEALTTIARDPRCLLAVSANDGGSWFAPLKEGGMTPRNFKGRPSTWTSFPAGSTVGTNPWTVQVTFTYSTDSAALEVFGVVGSSVSMRVTADNMLVLRSLNSAGTEILASTACSPDVQHIATIGYNNGHRQFYLDGVVVGNSADTAATPVFTGLKSDCNGTIASASLTVSGAVIWEAPQSELFALYPYPSPVERNFATEDGRFYDVGTTVTEEEMLNDDFEFECTFTNTSTSEGSVFYSFASNNLFGVYQYSPTKVGFSTGLAKDYEAGQYLITIKDSFDDNLNQKHTIVIKVIDTTVVFNLDGVIIASVKSVIRKTSGPHPAGVIARCGYLHSVKITNLTKNKLVWSYPTWPEKTRLMTYNNITTQNGFFTLANPSALGGVQTPLDLRGNTTSKTFICKANCHRSPDDGQLHSHALISQGYVWGTVSNYCFGFLVRQDYRASARSLSLYCMYSGASAAQGLMAYTLPETVLNNTCVYAGVLDMVKKRCFLYLNGNLLSSTGITGEPWRANPQVTGGIPVTGAAIRQEQHTLFLGGTDVYSAFVYEGALEAEEIAYISGLLADRASAEIADTEYFTLTVTPSSSAGMSHTITPYWSGGGFLRVTDWGDGNSTIANVSGDSLTHTYTAPGTYKIRLQGNCYNVKCGGPLVQECNYNWEALGALTTTEDLLKSSANLTSTLTRLPSTLINGSTMFYGNGSMGATISSLPETLIHGFYLFALCGKAALYIRELPSGMRNCTGMFISNGAADIRLRKLPPGITHGAGMFANTKAAISLTELAQNAPATGWTDLVTIVDMFKNCPNVTGSRSAFLAKCTNPSMIGADTAFVGTNTTE